MSTGTGVSTWRHATPPPPPRPVANRAAVGIGGDAVGGTLCVTRLSGHRWDPCEHVRRVGRPRAPGAARVYADLCSTSSGSTNLVIAPFTELEVIATAGGLRGDFGLIPPPPMSGDPAYEPLRESLPVRPSPVVERLAKLDALHSDEVLVRHSWVLVVGTTEVDGESRQVLQPLLSRPARLRRRSLLRRAAGTLADGDSGMAYGLTYVGDAYVNPAIDDPDRRAHLVETAAFGRGSLRTSTSEAVISRMPELTTWIRAAALAAGLPISRVLSPEESPSEWVHRRGLVAIPVHCLHTTRQVNPTSLRTTLSSWAGRPGVDRTAMGRLLGIGGPPPRPDAPTATVDSPLVLSPSQRDVVLRARSQPITVVSGAPGSGKTRRAVRSGARHGRRRRQRAGRDAVPLRGRRGDRAAGPHPGTLPGAVRRWCRHGRPDRRAVGPHDAPGGRRAGPGSRTRRRPGPRRGRGAAIGDRRAAAARGRRPAGPALAAGAASADRGHARGVRPPLRPGRAEPTARRGRDRRRRRLVGGPTAATGAAASRPGDGREPRHRADPRRGTRSRRPAPDVPPRPWRVVGASSSARPGPRWPRPRPATASRSAAACRSVRPRPRCSTTPLAPRWSSCPPPCGRVGAVVASCWPACARDR